MQHLRELRQRHARDLADVVPRKAHRQGLRLEPLAFAGRTVPAHHEARDAVLHQRALRGRESVQHVLARAHESALVAGLQLAAQRRARLGRREAGVHRNRRLLLGEENPVARFLRQIAPWLVDVDAHGDKDVAKVLTVPGRWPRGNGALADAERVVRHHRAFGHLEDASQSVADRAGALRCVGRKVFRIEHRLARRIVAGPRIKHAQQTRQRGDAAHRRARARRAALLLQGHRGRQTVNGIDRGHAHLVDQPARIGRDRFEIAPLGLGVERAESQRRFAGTGDSAEHHQGVARNVDVNIAKVMFACTANTHEMVGATGGSARHVFSFCCMP